jgi:hypothetical protein
MYDYHTALVARLFLPHELVQHKLSDTNLVGHKLFARPARGVEIVIRAKSRSGKNLDQELKNDPRPKTQKRPTPEGVERLARSRLGYERLTCWMSCLDAGVNRLDEG